jgi:hypothetical protein
MSDEEILDELRQALGPFIGLPVTEPVMSEMKGALIDRMRKLDLPRDWEPRLSRSPIDARTIDFTIVRKGTP